jgi:hypothetical protein
MGIVLIYVRTTCIKERGFVHEWDTGQYVETSSEGSALRSFSKWCRVLAVTSKFYFR